MCHQHHQQQRQHENLPGSYQAGGSLPDADDDEEVKSIISNKPNYVPHRHQCNNKPASCSRYSTNTNSSMNASTTEVESSDDAVCKLKRLSKQKKTAAAAAGNTQSVKYIDSSTDDGCATPNLSSAAALRPKPALVNNGACKYCHHAAGGKKILPLPPPQHDSSDSSSHSPMIHYSKNDIVNLSFNVKKKPNTPTSSKHRHQKSTMANKHTANNNALPPAVLSNMTYYFYGYSPVGGHNERVYAYDNFDCINECLEESVEAVVEDEEDEEEDKCFTSNLVEDGFIRMSSPVEEIDATHHDDNGNSTELDESASVADKSAFKFSATHHSHAAAATAAAEAGVNIPSGAANCAGCRGVSNCPNFPNVGSSPLSEEFINTSSENENDDDDEDEDDDDDDVEENDEPDHGEVEFEPDQTHTTVEKGNKFNNNFKNYFVV